MIYASKKFEFATSYCLEDTITRKVIDRRMEQLWHEINIPYFSNEKADIFTQLAELEKTFQILKEITFCFFFCSLQKDEERQAQIDYENKLLLTKMTTIMKYGGNLDNYNNYELRRLVYSAFL